MKMNQTRQKSLAAKIVGAIPKLLPHADLSELDIISSYDNYYYSRHKVFVLCRFIEQNLMMMKVLGTISILKQVK